MRKLIFILFLGFGSAFCPIHSNQTSEPIGISSTDTIQSPFCEGFTNPLFPPAGWTNSNPTLIFRVTQSGFTLGVGSAYCDFWNVAAGQTSDLTTPVFTPSLSGDSIGLDIAHCFFGSPDLVSLFNSTNGGVTYQLLVFNITPQPPISPQCTRPFIPTHASDWNRETYALPTGTNRLKFHAVSGFGDGVYIDSICVMHPVGIKTNNNNIPTSYSLYQNFPNPFNPITKIKFDIPKAPLSIGNGEGLGVRNITLIIYDALGREVATLVNKKLQPGSYEVEFEGKNYPSGIYLYRLTAGNFTESKTMVLIK